MAISTVEDLKRSLWPVPTICPATLMKTSPFGLKVIVRLTRISGDFRCPAASITLTMTSSNGYPLLPC